MPLPLADGTAVLLAVFVIAWHRALQRIARARLLSPKHAIITTNIQLSKFISTLEFNICIMMVENVCHNTLVQWQLNAGQVVLL